MTTADLTPTPCLNACGREVPRYRAGKPCLPCQADALGPLTPAAPIVPPAGIPALAWVVFAKPDAPTAAPRPRAGRTSRSVSVDRQLQLGGEL